MKHFFTLIFLLSSYLLIAQNNFKEISLGTTGLAGSSSSLPFWILHNQLGKYSTTSNLQELTEGKLFGNWTFKNNITLDYGADLSFRATEDGCDATIIQAYTGISSKLFFLKAGAFSDEELLDGLSSSNGNIVRSLDHRPYPMIRLSTQGFIPLFFSKKWLSAKAEYDEGLLHDQRIVDHPHLHHKSLHFKFDINPTFRITAGMDHYVFWGGTQEDGNRLPHGLKDYFYYILSKSGNSDFLETDQLNIAGNQLGSYLLTAEKDLKQYQLKILISHPFEDRSGMRLTNAEDNLYTFFIKKKETHTLLDALLFEFIYTKDQSGRYHILSENKKGRDNYFNHGIYKTGFSYEGYSMGTPLFFPMTTNSDGIITGFENTRISAFHIGAQGYISQQSSWKALFTYSHNFGTYASPYSSMREQCYSLLQYNWESPKHPLTLFVSLAADFGDLVADQWGGNIGVKYNFR